MTIEQLIAELSKYPMNTKVVIQITEPYDDDAATLTESVLCIKQEEDRVIIY